MDPQKREIMERRIIRWLLIATLALIILVLGLQAWRLVRSGPASGSEPLTQDAGASDSLNAPTSNAPAGGISSGKTAMIEDVRARNANLAFDDLAALSAEELEQLCETETPPDRAPIGLSRAAEQAEKYAGTIEVDSVTWDADPELDETPPHYEVELHHVTLGDFEYSIDAYTGEILEGQPNILQSTYVPASGGETAPATPPAQDVSNEKTPNKETPNKETPNRETPNESTPPSSGEETAKAAAFAHAGISPEDAQNVRVHSDWDDGMQIYEVDFRSGNTEYEYEIEAATGAVHKAEERWKGGSQPSGDFIGESAAQTAALTHAGVRSDQVSSFKIELDKDDGQWLYEIEFMADGVEYDYEIEAVTGVVRKAEQEH